MNTENTQQARRKKNRRVIFLVAALTIGMFGFGYAMVPLYNVLCEVTGLNGKMGNQAVPVTATEVDESRIITVQFLANVNGQTPLEFRTLTKKIEIHPGDVHHLEYYAKNTSDRALIAQGIPSVSPGLAAKYVQKTECFCFTQQTFEAGQEMLMPIRFVLDHDLPKNIRTLTMSYTMFDTEQALLTEETQAFMAAKHAWQ